MAATKKNANIRIAWKPLSSTAKKPCKPKSPDDAGFDLYSDEDKVVIKPHKTVLIKTGYAMQMTAPDGWNAFAEIKDTSGNAYKQKLSTKGGVIDIGYDGNVGVVIRNNNMFKKIVISRGDKIAQIIPFAIPEVEEVEWVDKTTVRGSDGYGSTGVAGSK